MNSFNDINTKYTVLKEEGANRDDEFWIALESYGVGLGRKHLAFSSNYNVPNYSKSTQSILNIQVVWWVPNMIATVVSLFRVVCCRLWWFEVNYQLCRDYKLIAVNGSWTVMTNHWLFIEYVFSFFCQLYFRFTTVNFNVIKKISVFVLRKISAFVLRNSLLLFMFYVCCIQFSDKTNNDILIYSYVKIKPTN